MDYDLAYFERVLATNAQGKWDTSLTREKFKSEVARASAALLVRGMLERTEGVTNLVAERIEALPLATQAMKARDFR